MNLNKFTSRCIISLIILLISALSGCSPNPASRNWQADGSNTLNITRIKVVFEGQADFYISDSDDSIRRCFWSAKDTQTLQMDCVFTDDSEKKENYQLTVTETGQAKLSQDGKLIGLFSEQNYQ